VPGKPYSLAYKQKLVAQLVGKDAVSARFVARENGLAQATLSRWVREARSLPAMAPSKNSPRTRSIDEKVRILADTAKLTGPELTAYLGREGVLLGELEQWRQALDEEGRSSQATNKRIRNLERELARKEKALAEAAALLVLKKKLQHLLEDEDDDTGEENEP
jgi:transposase